MSRCCLICWPGRKPLTPKKPWTIAGGKGLSLMPPPPASAPALGNGMAGGACAPYHAEVPSPLQLLGAFSTMPSFRLRGHPTPPPTSRGKLVRAQHCSRGEIPSPSQQIPSKTFPIPKFNPRKSFGIIPHPCTAVAGGADEPLARETSPASEGT